MTYIYGLYDPRTGELRYVGKTTNLRWRLSIHLSAARCGRAGHVRTWLRVLLREGLAPDFRVLEEVPAGGDWRARERHWIAFYREAGARLTNLTDGGDGITGLVHTKEARERIAAGQRGRVRSADTRRRISASLKGHGFTPETIEKMSLAKRGGSWSPLRRAAWEKKVTQETIGA